MEPLETPVKDGILYQQHVKFGKVGTLAARQLPKTVGVHPSFSPPPWRWENGEGSQGGGPNQGAGGRMAPLA